jgi:hypothetical protein
MLIIALTPFFKAQVVDLEQHFPALGEGAAGGQNIWHTHT